MFTVVQSLQSLPRVLRMRFRDRLDIVWKTIQGSKFAIAILAIVATVAYGAFYVPAIYSDDWSTVVAQVFGRKWQYVDWTQRRPFEGASYLALYQVFGMNIHVFYAVLGLLNILAAIQFYFLVRRMVPRKPSIALAAASIFLVYPVDYTHMWLTTIHIRMVLCLVFLYAWLLLAYADRGHLPVLLIALVCLIVSLGIYEGQLGIALAFCLLLALIKRHVGWQRRLALLAPIVIGTSFAVWRTIGYTAVGIADSYLTQIRPTPRVILERVATGFKVPVWGWTEPLRQWLGHSNNWPSLMVVLILVAACILGVFIVDHNRTRRQCPHKWSKQDRTLEARDIARMCVVGIAFVVAGYIPIAALYPPNLSGLVSRVNLFAIPGASLITVSMLGAVALLLGRDERQMEKLIAAGVVPLVALGMITQAWVQHDTRVAWAEQKQIWADLFDLAPNLTDDTAVYFVLPGYEERVRFASWQRTPLSARWEVSSALQTLYEKSNLQGDLVFPDVDAYAEVRLNENGVIDFWTKNITPYDHALFVVYDGNPRRLRLLLDLESELSVSWPTLTYRPYSRIKEGPAPPIEWRKLVGAPWSSRGVVK